MVDIYRMATTRKVFTLLEIADAIGPPCLMPVLLTPGSGAGHDAHVARLWNIYR